MAYPYPSSSYPGSSYPGAAYAPQPPIITNPPVPFTSAIYGGSITPGMMISIQGFVPAMADRFHVNFQCGQSGHPRPDIALHFNPRFRANQVVRNTLQNQKWGPEEKGQSYFPFACNQNFEIIILCENQQFKVAVNGHHFTEYNYRIKNLRRIDTISIDGQVQLYSVRFQRDVGGSAMGGGTVVNPPTPYTGPVANGMTPGKMIFISGKVRNNPQRFHVNLQCGAGVSPRPDIALHFNPRFREQTVVRNTLRNQQWGSEERTAPFFPFTPNGMFEIIILCEAHCFKVAVNGQHYVEYKHRIAHQYVNTLNIDGSVDIHQIRFQ